MKKARLEQVFARLNEPGVLISYNTEDKHPVECKVTSYACNDCTTEVIANRMNQPFCPSCSGELSQSSNKIMSFNKADFKELKPLVNCEACATSFVTNDETHKALASLGFNCPVCASTIKASSNTMDEDSDESSDDTSDDSDVTDVSDDDSTDSSDDSSTDSSDESGDSEDTPNDNSDEDETDSEIDEVMNNLSPDADTSTDGTDNTSTETPPADDTSSEDNTDDTSSENEEDDENKKKVDDEAVTAAFFKAAVKNTKKFDLIHASDYNHWYLIGDGKTPLAVSAFNDASPEIQPVFRSDSFKNAFESGKEADGGINTDLLKDFGFTPVEVNVDLDDVTKQHVEDEVAKKTDELNNKIEEIEDITAQCLGIAVMADIKGVFPVAASIRTPLINKLNSLKVRNPEAVIDEVLSKFMPDYMKALVTKASELSHKTESSLADYAEMVTSAEARTPVIASHIEKPANVVPFALMADSNPENHNLNSRESVESSDRAPNHDLKQVIGSLKRPSNGIRR